MPGKGKGKLSVVTASAEKSLRKFLKRIHQPAALPVVVTEVVRAANNPATTASILAAIVAKDPIISSKLVSTVNSSLFGFLNKANDLQTAIVRLGTNKVRSISLGLGMVKFFSGAEQNEGFCRANLWKHSIATAILGDILAKTLDVPGVRALQGEAFLAGLVHDIGIIFFHQYSPKRFGPLPGYSESLKEPLCKQEWKEFGFTHQELGAEMLRRWRFPAPIITAVARHHHPVTDDDSLLTALVALSELLAFAKRVGYPDLYLMPAETLSYLVKRLRLKKRTMRVIREQFEERMAEALKIFSGNTGSKTVVQHPVRQATGALRRPA